MILGDLRGAWMISEYYKKLCVLCGVKRKGARPNDFNWNSPPTVWNCKSAPPYAFVMNKEKCTNTLFQSEIKPRIISHESFVLAFAK